MPRLSRTSSASSQSYTTLPSSLDTSHNDSMSYYPNHHNGHHRMASLSSNGAGTGGPVGYYNHISDDISSPAALGDSNGSSSMTEVVANQAAYAHQNENENQHQHQHQQHHDALAVSMPLAMAHGTPAVMSNGAANGRGGPVRTGSVLGSVGSVASSIGSNNSSGHGRSYPVQMPESALPAHMHPRPQNHPPQHATHSQHSQYNQHSQHSQHSQHNNVQQTARTSSGAWTPQDDDALLQARARGENWAQIQTMFLGKTPNACRKRHERLMERRNATDFDARKMEDIAREYMSMRREIWQPLAERTGEKWTILEQKCMAAGLKNLQGGARAATRRNHFDVTYGVVLGAGGPYSELGQHPVGHPASHPVSHPVIHPVSHPVGHSVSDPASHHYVGHHRRHRHDNGPDVGIDDDLDVDVDLLDGTGMSAGVGSPSSSSPHGGASHALGGGNRPVSGGSNSSGASSARRQHHGHGHGHAHAQSSYPYSQPHAPPPAPTQPHQHTLSGSAGEVVSTPGYSEYYTSDGFSQSLRAVDDAPAATMTSPYASHQQGQASSHQPRMGNGDMGIDALLRR